MNAHARLAERPEVAARGLRFLGSRDLELRAATAGGGPGTIVGRAIPYGEWTTIRDYFGDYQEQIARGAATEALTRDDVPLLLNHDPSAVLARSRPGGPSTLALSEDAGGVQIEAGLPDTSDGRDVAELLRRGDLSGMSFAFESLAESWDVRPDGTWLRTVESVRLWDVSVVTYPAYSGAAASLRSLSVDQRFIWAGQPDRVAAPAPAARSGEALTTQIARHRAFAVRYGLNGRGTNTGKGREA
jgi:HK97 family phage prohead protease